MDQHVVASLAGDGPVDESALLPCGAEQLAAVIAGHVEQGITKFVVGPTERPHDWADELAWFRAATSPLER